MNRKIIVSLAMSIDGYVAKNDEDYSWIRGDGMNCCESIEKWDYNDFIKSVDIILMGRKCYEMGFYKDFPEKKIYVASNSEMDNHDNIHFIKGDIVSIIKNEQKKEGKNIFLFGGALTIGPFVEQNLIDEYVIGIIPIILGSGRKLFVKESKYLELKLNKYFVEDGVVIVHYKKRSGGI